MSPRLLLIPLAALPVLAPADFAEDRLRSLVAARATPGIVYAEVRNGRVARVLALGEANLETKAPVRRDTVFEIGSMTKQFTAAVVALMAKEGAWNLDDPVSKSLPGLPEAWRGVTIRQALSHTGGLKDYLGSYDLTRTDYVSPGSIVDKLGRAPLDFPAGTAWQYSNTGYLLATMMIEAKTGKKLNEVLAERIFRPLGMTKTRPSDPTEVIPNRARGYAWDGKKWLNTPIINPSLGSGAGYLVSTVDDLAKWSRALDAGKFPTDEMFRPTPLTNGMPTDYALGWFLHPEPAGGIVEHGGNTVGFSSNIYRVPGRKLAYIALTNGAGFNPGGPVRRILAATDPAYDLGRAKGTDPHPDRTMALTLTLRSWGRKNRPDDLFSPAFRSQLATLRGIAIRNALLNLGSGMKTLEWVQGWDAAPARYDRYRVRVGKGVIYMQGVWTADGKLDKFDSVYIE